MGNRSINPFVVGEMNPSRCGLIALHTGHHPNDDSTLTQFLSLVEKQDGKGNSSKKQRDRLRVSIGIARNRQIHNKEGWTGNDENPG